MSRDTFVDIINTLIAQVPFKPFNVELSSGDRIEIDHPRAIRAKGGAAIFLSPGGLPIWFEADGVTQIIGDLRAAAANP